MLPGYKYLGPGNGLDKGEPVNYADAVARDHDLSYNEQLAAGDNPYVKYNHADAELQEALQGDTSFGGNLARGVFQAKKRLLEPFGLVEPDLAPAKRKRPNEPAASQDSGIGSQSDYSQQDLQQIDDAEAGASHADAAAAGESSDLVPGTLAAGGGSPMGDDQQGADGVGSASGDWHCDSQWMGDRVLTRSTRTWILPSYNNHIYQQISDGTASGIVGNRYFGYSTPWGYFDFNRFHCHFSPRDWQRLVNNYWGFRPKRLHVKLFNIQVKEVTTQDQTTTIANNLTSTIQVFTDDEYQLPYVLGNATEGCLPAFPPDVFTLPQYGYVTLNNSNNGNPTERSSFFCLEYFPSKMLRTGNNFEFSFSFENVPFHTGFAPCQSTYKLSNPLVDQYLYRAYTTNTTGAVSFIKVVAKDWVHQYKNWSTGAHRRTHTWYTNNDVLNSPSSQLNTYANKARLGRNEEFETTPEVPGMCNTTDMANYTDKVALQNTLVFNNQTAAPGAGSALPIQNVLLTNESETAPVNAYAGVAASRVATNDQSNTAAPLMEDINNQGILPGAVWMDRDVYLHGPIWAKIPNTGAHFHPSPWIGGFGLKTPPPLMLVKNTPVPGNVTTFSDVKVNQFINQYSTGQVTVSIEWELQKENSKRWNPEMQYTNNYDNPTFVDFAPDSTGSYRTSRTIGTRWLTRPL